MPLPPDVRRARRAHKKALQEPRKFPRRRCQNCNKMYEKIRKNKRFCSRECKDEYHRYGSAFGPLKDWLTKLIGEKSKEAQNAALLELRDHLIEAGFVHKSQLRSQAPALRRTIEEQRRALDHQGEVVTATRAELSEHGRRIVALEDGIKMLEGRADDLRTGSRIVAGELQEEVLKQGRTCARVDAGGRSRGTSC